jgi:hypothetical protein
MNAALNIAQNVSVYYSSKGQEVEIQIVAFNAGLHTLRNDTSPVKPRLKSFRKECPTSRSWRARTRSKTYQSAKARRQRSLAMRNSCRPAR